MNSKLSINLTNGTLEVEGSEEFVREMYKDFKELLENGNVNLPDLKDNGTKPPKAGKPQKKSATKPHAGGAKSKPAGDLKFLTDLNLRPKGKDSLKDFSKKYEIKVAEELTLMVVYYLKEVLKEGKVTLNHLFTAYKEL